MPDQTFDLALDEARALAEGGGDLEAFLAGLPSAVQQAIRAELERLPVTIIRTEPRSTVWTDRVADGEWFHWNRLRECLRTQRGWDAAVVSSVAAESLRILGKMPDPSRPTFNGRGLVVGYVQSGKTANYTAVAARAVDAGYRLIIVLSGIHDSLRNQTQARLERELTGHLEGGVGVAQPGRRWIRLTAPDHDFDGNADPGVLQSPAPILMVAKKLVPILEKIDRWLVAAGDDLLAGVPVLIIDDEADQASINTRGNRDPTVSDDDEPQDESAAPTKTNGLIRQILSRMPRVCYAAYTATPFANILVDPEGIDRVVGEELFPRDFVVQLPRPAGYTGTEELFGVSASDRDLIRMVPDEQVRMLRVGRQRRGGEVRLTTPELPDTLVDALLDFLVVGAVRRLRGQTGRPNTMLVHVSQRIADQTRISAMLAVYLAALRDQIRLGAGEVSGELAGAWERNKGGVESPPADSEVIRVAMEIAQEVEIVELNSSTGSELDYDLRPGRQVVAVGGNRLSRGLTIEGLTVSYFLRTTSMCDTLLQMGRWYGYRNGYEDLIRIWTTEGIARWFSELALVEQSLRDSIVELNRSGMRPDQMAIRLRAHSELLLTSASKSRQAVEVMGSWSGEHPQTVLLPLGDLRALAANREAVERLLGIVGPAGDVAGGYIARDVQPEDVVNFLSAYQIHPDVRAFDIQSLVRWIASRNAEGELVDWTVLLASSGQATRRTELAGLTVGLPYRRRLGGESIGILIDPKHEAADLDGGAEAFWRGKRYDSDAMRGARPVTQALLIIYPLDAVELGVGGIDTVIALALSFPHTSDAGQNWVVNRALLGAEHA